MSNTPSVSLSLMAVIAAVTDDVPRILLARDQHSQSDVTGYKNLAFSGTLPCGPFDPASHRSLDHGCRQWVETRTGLALQYVEQLYTFGGRNRDPQELHGAGRLVSIAYLALTRETGTDKHNKATWHDWYSFLPWEDWRAGRPELIDRVIMPCLRSWAEEQAFPVRKHRLDRIDLAFGTIAPGTFDPVRALDRYELLYEAGLVHESRRDANALAQANGKKAPPVPDTKRNVIAALGKPMEMDHRRVLASALTRLRGKLAWRPVVFDLVPDTFTLLQLQRVVEALFGTTVHKQNFRRTIASMDLVEPTGKMETQGRGRPAELFRFRRAAILERRTLGIGVPVVRGEQS
ncbi:MULTISPECIES: NrtR DNA-binding winged helix domain-containing protein [unclassified Haematospirillum]|uniref:NUDIX hydrolase n=1 Tax=unclassified Haematospirillum TaxID=2622088 RepID=UPI002AC3217F|nr:MULTISPECIES: hypothetical protein [unclassified Haematospirillum]